MFLSPGTAPALRPWHLSAGQLLLPLPLPAPYPVASHCVGQVPLILSPSFQLPSPKCRSWFWTVLHALASTGNVLSPALPKTRSSNLAAFSVLLPSCAPSSQQTDSALCPPCPAQGLAHTGHRRRRQPGREAPSHFQETASLPAPHRCLLEPVPPGCFPPVPSSSLPDLITVPRETAL